MLPVFVIPPCWRRWPEEYSDGTNPKNFISSLGCSKRVKSPISATMVTATVNCTPRRGLEGVHHGMQAPRGDLLAEFLVQTPEALGVLRDGPDIFLKDDLLRRGGTDDFREPPEVGRTPVGPARIADILAEQEGFETELGIFEIADRIFARPREIPDGFIVHFGDIDRGEIA